MKWISFCASDAKLRVRVLPGAHFSLTQCKHKNMKKIYFIIGFLTLAILSPFFANAAGLVPCGNPGQPACTIGCFFVMLANIYDFLVKWIAAPLATLAITIGAVMLMISAGNPNLATNGKKVLWAAIIGLALVFCSWLIINTLLSALGFNMGSWFNPNLGC